MRWYGGLRNSSSGRARVSHMGKILISRFVETKSGCGTGSSYTAGLPVAVSTDTSAQSSVEAGRCVRGEIVTGFLKHCKSCPLNRDSISRGEGIGPLGRASVKPPLSLHQVIFGD